MACCATTGHAVFSTAQHTTLEPCSSVPLPSAGRGPSGHLSDKLLSERGLCIAGSRLLSCCHSHRERRVSSASTLRTKACGRDLARHREFPAMAALAEAVPKRNPSVTRQQRQELPEISMGVGLGGTEMTSQGIIQELPGTTASEGHRGAARESSSHTPHRVAGLPPLTSVGTPPQCTSPTCCAALPRSSTQVPICLSAYLPGHCKAGQPPLRHRDTSLTRTETEGLLGSQAAACGTSRCYVLTGP